MSSDVATGMAISFANAQRLDADFAVKAEAAILAHLRIVKECPGEDLTDIAKAQGAIPHDDRAFGNIFSGLRKRGLIRTVGFCLRKRGNHTAGGRIWGIVDQLP